MHKYFTVMKRLLLPLIVVLLSMNLSAENKVMLSFNHLLNGEPFEIEKVTRTNMDFPFNISRLEYYISEIEIMHDGGKKTVVENFWILLNVKNSNSFELGKFDINNVEGIKFSIGVDSAHNHLDPSQYSMEHPLAPKSPSMHWGWASGYRFVCLEGKAGQLHPDMEFELHALGDDYYYTVNLESGAEITNDGLNIIVNADYAHTVYDIDITGGIQIHGEHEQPIAMLKNFRDRVFTPATAPTSVENESELANAINVFPNPSADGRFNITINNENFSSNSDISIYDINGRLVKKFNSRGDAYKTFELTQTGIYVIVLTDGLSKSFIKIIVE